MVFALHFHQPHGNLDVVFADAMDRCYLRTLELFEAYPNIAAAIHVSGPLLSWAEEHRPTMIDKLAMLVARGQIEVLGGGHQEPMLAILPDRDAVGQLTAMSDHCARLLGARPRGMWLAERVWEPDLARTIAAAGYHYTLLDDSHLRAAGASEPLGAYYVTDKAGSTVAVFPIDRGLRTRIPYAEVDELVDYLHGQRGQVSTYGDDVEKFGLWPTTERRVWTDRWLQRFFDALGKHGDWLEITTPGRVLDDTPSSGTIYIPTISYQEMGGWALPTAAAVQYGEVAQRMDLAGYGEQAASFLRGGIWQAFLAKYPESNLIYRKMLRVSAAVERARQDGHPAYEQARAALYQGQCNCAYWHGLFGGLYLQHLRAALMTALLEAEALISSNEHAVLSQVDHDGDLRQELMVESPELNVYVSPSRGGSAIEIDLCAARHHLTGVLGRRPEAYHEDVPRARVISDEELGNISAHDLIRATEEGLADKLLFDAYPRGAFVDHLLPAHANPDMMDRGYAPLADFANAAYHVVDADAGTLGIRTQLQCELGARRIDKHYAVSNAKVTVRYEVSTDEAFRFASQVDVTLLSPDAVGGRRIEVDSVPDADVPPGARQIAGDVRRVRVACDDMGVDVSLCADPPAELWRLPIETVSQSDRGFERAYQGTALVFVWDADQRLDATLSLHVC